MPQLLISVTSIAEAEIALQHAVDIIDLKDPAQGALGALPLEAIIDIASYVNKSSYPYKKITSATIGDVPLQPALLLKQVAELAGTPVDIIKIGFFMEVDSQPQVYQACLDALKTIVDNGAHLVAVLFAEIAYPDALLPAICKAGFTGIMFDTLHKDGTTFLDYYSVDEMRKIASRVQKAGLHFGLAGSLNVQHLPRVKAIAPDYIGFRGGVCFHHARTTALDSDKIRVIRAQL